MKLTLDKQKVTKLSANDMNSINGGGEKWSDFWSGNCKYSNNNADTVELYDPQTGGCIDYKIGCKATQSASRKQVVVSQELRRL